MVPPSPIVLDPRPMPRHSRSASKKPPAPPPTLAVRDAVTRSADPPTARRPIDWRKLGREFVVTFVGVLLALAANAAWVRQQEARRERAALLALRAEMESYRSTIARFLAREDSAMHADTMLLSMLRGERPLSADSVRSWASPLLWNMLPATPGTAVGLTQTGDATVLRDPELRTQIAAFVASATSATTGVEQVNEVHLREMSAMSLLLEPYAASDGPSDSQDRLARALPGLRGSMQFRTSLYTIATMRSNRLGRLAYLHDAAGSLVAALPAPR